MSSPWVHRAAVVTVLASCAGQRTLAEPREPAPVASSGEAQRSPVPEPTVDPPPALVEPPARSREDARATGLVTVSATYRAGGRTHHQRAPELESRVTACFDREIPIGHRQPVTYYVHVFVLNPDHDRTQGGSGFGGGGVRGGIAYPEPGTYPAFEACVVAAIPSYRAPADVAMVELQMHLHTRATSVGTIGHGAGP